jgi:ubiquinone/menaquinone biosynthesis C-methylase UbiE
MPNELENFQTSGPSWQERAEKYDDISAVYAPGDERVSNWFSLLTSCCLNIALKKINKKSAVVDFGCGIGHHTHIIYKKAGLTMGFDITSGMVDRAKNIYRDLPIRFETIDGIHLPVQENSVDLIWVCGVLRYSLLVPNPKHKLIIDEFYRVLKPGGYINNYEMYVDLPSEVFSKDFVDRGFRLLSVSLVHKRGSGFDKMALGKYQYYFLRSWWAQLSIIWTSLFRPNKDLGKRIRDYFFVYQKPPIESCSTL